MTRETTPPAPAERRRFDHEDPKSVKNEGISVRRIENLAFSLLFFVLFATSCFPAYSAEDPAITEGSVVVVPLEGPVSDAQFVFLRRILKESESAKASALIIDMDTPGGELGAGVEILQLLLKAELPTYTWINTNAGSAGALIALGTDHIYMAPVSAVGAAAIVSGNGQDIGETMNDKLISYYSGYFRSAAEAKGHNPELAEAFINKKKVLKVGDITISPYDSLLTLGAQEAVKTYDGRPLFAAGIADSLADLKEQAGLQGPTVEIQPSGFERVAQLITMLAPLFLLGGIIGAYLEFKSPGFGVAGFISAACFLIFFAGHTVAGLTGMEVVAVFVLGLLLVIFELFFFPGLVIVSLVGTALMLGSILFAMVDYYPGDPVIPPVDALVTPMLNLGITIVLAIVIISILARYLPNLPVFHRIVLGSQVPAGPSITHASRDVYDLAAKIGDTGFARSPLRPSGKAEIGAAWLDVITDGEYLEVGTPIRVIEVTANRILVARA